MNASTPLIECYVRSEFIKNGEVEPLCRKMDIMRAELEPVDFHE